MNRELFRADRLPVFQNRAFASVAEAKASATGNVVLVQSEQTGLVFNAEFDPALLCYDGEYQNEQACSGVFREHLADVAAIVGRHFKGQRLIEVGCGKGYFLEYLAALGYQVTGIDPAYEGDNPRVIKAPFERGLGLSADAIVLRHVLEHVSDPLAFLAEIADANGGRGSILIEVPCLDWILAHRAWFDIFYEHVNYFRLADFERMFSRIHERGHVFGGQYLCLVADLASLRSPRADPRDRVAMPADFRSGVDRAISVIADSRGKSNAVWGAASKGVIFCVYLQRAGIVIDEVIDINPAKQGRYLACGGLRVRAPEEAAGRLKPQDNLFVMNSNYRDEIIAQSRNLYTYHTVEHEQLR